MKALFRELTKWIFPSAEAVKLGRFPPEQRAARKLATLWAMLLVQIAMFALVTSGEIVGCPTKQLLSNASVEQLFPRLSSSN